jgi:hypothetical protein
VESHIHYTKENTYTLLEETGDPSRHLGIIFLASCIIEENICNSVFLNFISNFGFNIYVDKYIELVILGFEKEGNFSLRGFKGEESGELCDFSIDLL